MPGHSLKHSPSTLAALTDATQPKLNDFIQLGRYTVFVCVTVFLMIFCTLANQLFMMFAGVTPDVIACGEHDLANLTNKQACAQVTRLWDAGESCDVELSSQFRSVNVEWQLFCGDAKVVKLSTSVQMIGVMVGSMIFGQLSDLYGRRKTLLLANGGCIVGMILSTLTHDLVTFTAVRFGVNVFNGGILGVMIVFCVECVPRRDRLWINNIVSSAPNYVCVAVVAYIAGEWRTFAWLSAAITLPAFIMLFFLSESPSYLAQQGRLKEAEAAIVRMCKFDGRECDVILLRRTLIAEQEHSEKHEAKAKKYTYIHLFANCRFSLYIFVLSLSYFATSLINYGLIFNMERVSGSIYVNTMIVGILRCAINIVTAFMDFKFLWFGRKVVHVVALTEIASACTLIFGIHLLGLESTYSAVIRVAVVSVVAFTVQLYIGNSISCGELFPTCIRNLAYSFVQFFTRIGVVLGPQVVVLGDLWDPLPYVTLATFAFVDMFLFTLVVPETKNKPLPDTMPTPANESAAALERSESQTLDMAPLKA